MRILEILLPKGTSDKSLSPQKIRKIDALQHRMTGYVDKICDPTTSKTRKEFFQAHLKKDYDTFKAAINEIAVVSEASLGHSLQWPELVNKLSGVMRATGWKSSKHGDNGYMFSIKGQEGDNQYYAVIVEHDGNSCFTYALGTVEDGRPYIDDSFRGVLPLTEASLSELINTIREGYGLSESLCFRSPKLNEAVHKLPLSDKDFEVVKRIMENPIPAAIASIYLIEIIDDDELNDQIRTLEDTEPNRDIRPFVVSWLDRVMPDQMHRFGQPRAGENERKGLFSPIHGYDPKMYKGSNESLTGNAYGKF